MNVVAWVLQAVLAVVYVLHGTLYAVSPEPLVRGMRDQGRWPPAIPDSFRRFIGIAEYAAAVGLVVPGLIHVATWLTPLAALGLAIVMIGAAVFHARRGETAAVATAIVLLVLVAFTGYVRWQVVPL
jgi:uncharacterized membrane protein YphA (DoxX/SURF4 family)